MGLAGASGAGVTRRAVCSFIAAILALCMVVDVGPAHAANADPPRRIMSGWLPYWTTTESTRRVIANADLFNEVSPFWFSAVTVGSGLSITSQIDPSTRSSIGAQLNGRGIRVLPTITDGTRPGVMAARLRGAKTRAALVSQLVALTDQPHVDGIDLDWENFAFRDGQSTWATTRPAWVAFISSLASQLHKRHKLLAVTTPPLYDAGQTPSSGYWVYAWAAIAASIDRLRVMTYDYNFQSPGPIAPYPWVDSVAAFAVTQVPAGKVEIGVAAYGRDWIARKADNSLDITGVCPVDNPPLLKSPRMFAGIR
jgi:spore germination protein YaaH